VLGSGYQDWIDDQIALPASTHRAYYRKRVNPHYFENTNVGASRAPCQKGSRWQAFAFSLEDLGKYVHVRDSEVFIGSTLTTPLSLRTRLDPIGAGNGVARWSPWHGLELFAKICLVEEFVGGNVQFCDPEQFPATGRRRRRSMNGPVQKTLPNPKVWLGGSDMPLLRRWASISKSCRRGYWCW
jgi:hypothetical protein